MSDTVEAAAAAGITAIIQPGGSIKIKIPLIKQMNTALQWYSQAYVTLNINC